MNFVLNYNVCLYYPAYERTLLFHTCRLTAFLHFVPFSIFQFLKMHEVKRVLVGTQYPSYTTGTTYVDTYYLVPT